MSEISEETVFSRLWAVDYPLPDESQHVLFDEGKNELVMINATGALIWSLIDGKRTVRSIVDELTQLADGAPPRAEAKQAVCSFLEDLHRRQAVACAEGRP